MKNPLLTSVSKYAKIDSLHGLIKVHFINTLAEARTQNYRDIRSYLFQFPGQLEAGQVGVELQLEEDYAPDKKIP